MRYAHKKVVIVGGSGFVGTQLALRLMREGSHVIIIDPHPSPLKSVEYIQSDLSFIPDFEALQHVFVIFNLAGVPIFGRWTKHYMKLVRSSRVDLTRRLVSKCKMPEFRPQFLVSTSAIGVYGDRGDEMLDESSSTTANTYLAQVAADWEKEALAAKEFGIEVRIIRNAHVIGQGGILGVLKKVFRFGLGGSLGSGAHYMSLVSIDRCIETYCNAPFGHEEIKNAVSMYPVTNREFSSKVARAMKRPCLFRIPVWGLRMVYGDFAREIVTSQRVQTKYDPEFEDLNQVLRENL